MYEEDSCPVWSPLAQGRGLKHKIGPRYIKAGRVAPRAGAWIETLKVDSIKPGIDVAPRAGAWIETRDVSLPYKLPQSPLAQGRGLKHVIPHVFPLSPPVAPRAGAWIETRRRIMCQSVSLVAPRAGAWIETRRRVTGLL